MAGKWFCGFGLTEAVPDHSLLCRVRKRIGTKKLSELFAAMRSALSKQGLVSEVFTFVDAISFNLKRIRILDPPTLVMT